MTIKVHQQSLPRHGIFAKASVKVHVIERANTASQLLGLIDLPGHKQRAVIEENKINFVC